MNTPPIIEGGSETLRWQIALAGYLDACLFHRRWRHLFLNVEFYYLNQTMIHAMYTSGTSKYNEHLIRQ